MLATASASTVTVRPKASTRLGGRSSKAASSDRILGNARRQAGSAEQRAELGPQRSLRVRREGLVEGDLQQRAAVQDHRPHGVRVEAQVDLRRSGTVGRAVEVDLLVAERAAHRVEVVHRDGGRVEANLRAQPVEAAPDVRGDGRRLLDADARGRTAQPVRATRAALVDEHEVPGRSDPTEELLDDRDVRARRSARPAGEVEERTGRRLLRRGDDGDAQGDTATARPVRILRNGEAPAPGVDELDLAVHELHRASVGAGGAGHDRGGGSRDRGQGERGHERTPEPDDPPRPLQARPPLLFPDGGVVEKRILRLVRPHARPPLWCRRSPALSRGARLASRSTEASSTHSTVSCSPPPRGPKSTVGIPAAASSAESAQ